MPQIIKAPVRTLRVKAKVEQRSTVPFHEKEIERNRLNAVPDNATGYGKEPFTKSSSRSHSSSTGNWRTRDEYTYGVTYYLP